MRLLVFWPPAIILVAAVLASLVDFDAFLAAASAANTAILKRFGFLFVLAAFCAVVLSAVIVVSPLGAVRIGGANAKPILPRWNWFAITLCTTIATGILFWAAAEPIYHLNTPPEFASADPCSVAASRFALATLFLHWSITPYAIYAIPSLAFALAYYNLRGAYSLSAPLSLALKPLGKGVPAAFIDAIALFALVAGVAASLGAGVMTLAGGLGAMFDAPTGAVTRLLITFVIVLTYVASSISGLQKGIRFLSDINIRFFLVLAAFVLIAGPTLDILGGGVQSFGRYVSNFLPRSLAIASGADGAWQRDWTVFYFANWLAWAPITALFLGRIAVGYTVREFMLFNLALPAFFGVVWMTIFGGAAISFDLGTDGALTEALTDIGPEAVAYVMFDLLPLTSLVVAGFLFTTFVSFVTAMDSNTHSIASVCLRATRQSDETPGVGLAIKIFWGVLIGAVAWIMTATNGIDGVRMLSNLGGGPGLVILIGCMVAMVRLLIAGPAQLSGNRA